YSAKKNTNFKSKILNWSEEQFDRIMERLDRLESIFTLKAQLGDDFFIDNAQFMRLMNISIRTAQKWRNERIIAYSQVGSKVYYCIKDIKHLLASHKTQTS
ncbi:MAG: helix-turn-helix domain-containing protein, partial [Bacteroidetes bacterium]|nr:helix-turn-helix domain-containing protein [Bacteroidota bacterium]